MALARPSTSGNRPAYLDNLYRGGAPVSSLPTSGPQRPLPPLPASVPQSPSLRSANSSASFNSASAFDVRVVHTSSRPLSPAFEEGYFSEGDDRISVQSLRLHLSPRRKLRDLMNRRTYPQVKETVEFQSGRSTPSLSNASSRRPSLPKIQTSFSSQARKGPPTTSKPLPAIPRQPKAEELKCQPCYYFAARNCNGYVFGGSHGDACETCAVGANLLLRRDILLTTTPASRLFRCTLNSTYCPHHFFPHPGRLEG